ncbi:hypothetical protein ACFUN8_18595 [Streptomyces sp. NPDC057307]|uniref:hypothetical protein n=1 Tax=Streptomyces sp. NPDC057307 TaxID=3346096 RepID=UPI00363D4FD2
MAEAELNIQLDLGLMREHIAEMIAEITEAWQHVEKLLRSLTWEQITDIYPEADDDLKAVWQKARE